MCDLVLEGYLSSKPQTQLRDDLVAKVTRLDPRTERRLAEKKAEDLLRKWMDDAVTCRRQYQRFLAMGGKPIGLLNVKRVYEQIRRALDARSRDGWKVVLLRFTGHGGPGSQGVAASKFAAAGVSMNTSRITIEDKDSEVDVVEAIVIGGMTTPMASFGIVELHGCKIGRIRGARKGKPAVNGPGFVTAFADAVGRPTSAGVDTQFVGNTAIDVRFEGPSITVIPGGGSVESWSRKDPF